jgi:hypothetical protein
MNLFKCAYDQYLLAQLKLPLIKKHEPRHHLMTQFVLLIDHGVLPIESATIVRWFCHRKASIEYFIGQKLSGHKAKMRNNNVKYIYDIKHVLDKK